MKLLNRLAAVVALTVPAALAPLASSSAAVLPTGPSIAVSIDAPVSSPAWWHATLGTITVHSDSSTIASVSCTNVVLTDLTGIGTATATATLTAAHEGTFNTSCKAADAAGLPGISDFYSLRVDYTPPTLDPVVTPQPLLLGAVATVTPNGADALSGLATAVCPALDTSALGSRAFTCSATDVAANYVFSTSIYTVGLQTARVTPVAGTSVRRGSTVTTTFALLDANGGTLPDAQASALGCQAQVAFAGGPTKCPTYSTRTDKFTTSWSVPKSATLGAHPIAVSVTYGGALISSGGTSITVTR